MMMKWFQRDWKIALSWAIMAGLITLALMTSSIQRSSEIGAIKHEIEVAYTEPSFDYRRITKRGKHYCGEFRVRGERAYVRWTQFAAVYDAQEQEWALCNVAWLSDWCYSQRVHPSTLCPPGFWK